MLLSDFDLSPLSKAVLTESTFRPHIATLSRRRSGIIIMEKEEGGGGGGGGEVLWSAEALEHKSSATIWNGCDERGEGEKELPWSAALDYRFA